MASLPVDLSAYIEKPTVAWHVTTFVSTTVQNQQSTLKALLPIFIHVQFVVKRENAAQRKDVHARASSENGA
jgi:type IV secretory pathway component VirB8